MSKLATGEGSALPLIANVRRRALLSYRVAVSEVERQLPASLRPYQRAGQAFVSVCYSDIRGLRLRSMSQVLGLSFQYVALRTLVEVETHDGADRAVYILRAFSDSRIGRLGSRIAYGLRLLPAQIRFADDEGSGWSLKVDTGASTLFTAALSDASGVLPKGSSFGGIGEAVGELLGTDLGIAPVDPGDAKLSILRQRFTPVDFALGLIASTGGDLFGDFSNAPTPDHALIGSNVPYQYAAWRSRVSLSGLNGSSDASAQGLDRKTR